MVAVWISLTLVCAPLHVVEPLDNNACKECHEVPGLTVRDPTTGRSTLLYIAPDDYRASAHRELDCVACHRTGYGANPHRAPSVDPGLGCVQCHRADDALTRFQVEKIEVEISRSVHAQIDGAPRTCHGCHDAHRFLQLASYPSPRGRVRASNRMCMRCHEEGKAFEDDPGAILAHEFLPNPELHFARVRCVVCHTPAVDSVFHDVVPTYRAERDCHACHGQDAPRLATLFPHDGQAQAVGFSEPGVMTQAYIIGATRAAWLDRLGFSWCVLLALWATLHAIARARGWGRSPLAIAKAKLHQDHQERQANEEGNEEGQAP